MSANPTLTIGKQTNTSVALWFFIAVASSLFLLFSAAYVMRMNGNDWSMIDLPWQLWLSTGLLTLTSVLLAAANKTKNPYPLMASWGSAVLFLFAQLWVWKVLQASHITASGNPAASFFYLLTAMHGLHVLGGLVALFITIRTPSALRIKLCARYWHFLLIVWLVLFAMLSGLTPHLVRIICGTA